MWIYGSALWFGFIILLEEVKYSITFNSDFGTKSASGNYTTGDLGWNHSELAARFRLFYCPICDYTGSLHGECCSYSFKWFSLQCFLWGLQPALRVWKLFPQMKPMNVLRPNNICIHLQFKADSSKHWPSSVYLSTPLSRALGKSKWLWGEHVCIFSVVRARKFVLIFWTLLDHWSRWLVLYSTLPENYDFRD